MSGKQIVNIRHKCNHLPTSLSPGTSSATCRSPQQQKRPALFQLNYPNSRVFSLFGVVTRPPHSRKTALPRNDDIVRTFGAVDDSHLSRLAKTANDSDVRVARIEREIAGARLRPRYCRAIAVLRGRTAAVADDIRAVRDVIKHPIYEARTIQPVGADRSRSAVALRRDGVRCAPARVPAKAKAFDSDR